MLVSRKWLAEYVDIEVSSKEYEDAMTMSGSKVEVTIEPSKDIKNVVVGRVEAIERMPDSDRLWVCQVDIGRETPVQIITGADNVKAGDIVPVALHKSKLPCGKKIEKGKIRGYKSEGMLCSLGELNLDLHDFPYADPDGIFIMQEECSIGDDMTPIIGADTDIVEFEITSNRPDCLSMIGIARESAATFGAELRLPEPKVKGSGGDISEMLSVEIANLELCPRYTARMIKNIKIEPSPRWMRQRLRAAGVRPINNLVDITNYVMLEYGQPMHAFDYACLEGGKIIVRTAGEGETMNTLDGTPRLLTADMLVIADAKKPVGVAGVMGGENSEITETTRYAVLESANFNGVSIRKTAAALGMRTDASSRFEKGLDIENTYPAVERACELVELLGAGEVIDGILDTRASVSIPVKLALEPERINKLLGTEVNEQFMIEILEKLGFGISADEVASTASETAKKTLITVPSWRRDVEHYTDLAEEIARFYGYEVITPTLYSGGGASGGFTAKQSAERDISALCRALGYSEICTYSFFGQADLDKINLPSDSPLRNGVTICNPLGEDTSLMRTVSLPAMLGALAKNSGQRASIAKLYEMATVYNDVGEQLPDERQILTLGAYGDCDFFSFKGVCETVFSEMRVRNVRFEAQSDNPAYHPGRTAAMYCGDVRLGILGQIHPEVAKNYDLPESYAAEIDFVLLLECAQKESVYTPLPRFPSITRDLALVCDLAVTAASLSDCISRSGGGLLRSVNLFDIYTGSQIPEGKKSAAFSLTLRSDDKTLTDEDADEVIKNILVSLKSELGAELR